MKKEDKDLEKLINNAIRESTIMGTEQKHGKGVVDKDGG